MADRNLILDQLDDLEKDGTFCNEKIVEEIGSKPSHGRHFSSGSHGVWRESAIPHLGVPDTYECPIENSAKQTNTRV